MKLQKKYKLKNLGRTNLKLKMIKTTDGTFVKTANDNNNV